MRPDATGPKPVTTRGAAAQPKDKPGHDFPAKPLVIEKILSDPDGPSLTYDQATKLQDTLKGSGTSTPGPIEARGGYKDAKGNVMERGSRVSFMVNNKLVYGIAVGDGGVLSTKNGRPHLYFPFAPTAFGGDVIDPTTLHTVKAAAK